jgi:hypothetical protein
MSWPTPQEYNEALQNPRLCFADEELKAGSVLLDKLHLPKATTGSFASVYSITCGDKRYAVRCFLHKVPDLAARYERLSKAICADTLEYTVDFQYQVEGIRIGSRSYPLVKMPWVEGQHLDVFIHRHRENRDKLSQLQVALRRMSTQLLESGFAHGDLQHGNILIGDQGVRLIDYDGMYVPALCGFLSNELGHRNYQHPGRSKEHFNAMLDNFALWVIDTSLTCFIEDSSLVERTRGFESLLFRRPDFANPAESATFLLLETHDNETIRTASRMLRTVISCLPHNVPPLSADIPQAPELAAIVKASAGGGACGGSKAGRRGSRSGSGRGSRGTHHRSASAGRSGSSRGCRRQEQNACASRLVG